MIDLKEALNQDVRNPESMSVAGDDFIILDNPELVASGRFPYRNDWLIATLCEDGSASGIINLREFHIEHGGFIIILPGQVIVESTMSEDFKGKIILMSKRFSDTLDIGRTLSITVSIANSPYYEFQQGSMEIVRSYISSCRAMINQNSDQQTLMEVLRLLSRAFFMGTAALRSNLSDSSTGKSYSRITENFLDLIEKDYRISRRLDYYAEKLGRNSKYLSRIVKQETGLNASDWIDKCVIMDAKAQLLSREKTVSEVSESLGFPSQSFFGKYFKRVTGLSPKEFLLKERKSYGKSDQS